MKNKVNLWGTHGATILGITLVLFMLGLLLSIEYHSYRLTHDAQERITYKVDLSPDVSDSLALVQKGVVEKMSFVKHVDYISKEKAAEIFTEDLGEDFVGFIGYNPLYPSLMVNFNVQLLPDNSTEVLDRFCTEVSRLEGVTGVVYQENVVNELREVFYKLSWFLIVFVALLLIITVVLIASLIRIAIYSRRESIATMRMVGATASFVARPFLWRSVLYGALGGIFASILTFITLWVADNEFELQLIAPEHWMWYGGIALVLVVAGVVISYLSTAITVHRYIAKS
ncbi:MAG: permease-like cell division protein FtsX [Bacteroidales bacterium]|jgi:cell division transport system permease protein|nr:permease-like cell division protein FtsX [Bacteroidales bacterium]